MLAGQYILDRVCLDKLIWKVALVRTSEEFGLTCSNSNRQIGVKMLSLQVWWEAWHGSKAPEIPLIITDWQIFSLCRETC